MAFKANTVDLQTGFNLATTTAKVEKQYLQAWYTKLASNIDAIFALEMLNNLSRTITTLNSVSALPGLQAYAQQQFGSPAYDVAAEFTAMVNALTAIESWLKTNIPSNSVSIVNGVLTGNTYTPAQTAALRTLVNTAITTIE